MNPILAYKLMMSSGSQKFPISMLTTAYITILSEDTVLQYNDIVSKKLLALSAVTSAAGQLR